MLKTITKKVVSYCEIPEGIIPKGHWLNQHGCDAYIECHLEDDIEDVIEGDELDDWLRETYPELIDEESFFIHIDY